MTALHRSSGIYRTAQDNPIKPQLGGSFMKDIKYVIPQMLHPNDVSKIAQHIRKGTERIEGTYEEDTDLNCFKIVIKVVYRVSLQNDKNNKKKRRL